MKHLCCYDARGESKHLWEHVVWTCPPQIPREMRGIWNQDFERRIVNYCKTMGLLYIIYSIVLWRSYHIDKVTCLCMMSCCPVRYCAVFIWKHYGKTTISPIQVNRSQMGNTIWSLPSVGLKLCVLVVSTIVRKRAFCVFLKRSMLNSIYQLCLNARMKKSTFY
jgi:hypothetical protein